MHKEVAVLVAVFVFAEVEQVVESNGINIFFDFVFPRLFPKAFPRRHGAICVAAFRLLRQWFPSHKVVPLVVPQPRDWIPCNQTHRKP